MLRIIQFGNNLPITYGYIDPNIVFEEGLIAQLSLYGNNIVCNEPDIMPIEKEKDV